MNKHLRSFILILLTGMLCTGMFPLFCATADSATPEIPVLEAAAAETSSFSIALHPAQVTLYPRQTVRLSVTFDPENAENKEILWHSSRPSVASADENGLLTASSAGTCVIQAVSAENPDIYAICEVTVTESETIVNPNNLTNLRQRIITGGQRENGFYYISRTDENASEYKIIYRSDLGVLRLYAAMGNALSPEGAFYIETDYDISGQYLRTSAFSVSFEKIGSPIISVNAEAAVSMTEYAIGDELPVTILDQESENAEAFKDVENAEDNTENNTADYREAFQKSASKAISEAMNGWNLLLSENDSSLKKIGFLNCAEPADDGKETEPNDSKSTATRLENGAFLLGELDDDYFEADLEKGKRYRISIDPYTARYASSSLLIYLYLPGSDSYIDMSSAMQRNQTDYFDYSPETSGTYYIRLWNYSDSSHQYAELPYMISLETLDYQAVTDLKITPSSLTIPAGTIADLTAVFTPSDATNQTVKWESSAPAIATVNNNGRVTAVRQGTVTITASAEEGGFTASCPITVLFNDVTNPKKALYIPVYELAARDVVKGYGSYFAPDSPCTRAQFVLFLWRYAGKPVPKSRTLTFVDKDDILSMSAEYRKAILWGTENGIIKGFFSGDRKGKFMPYETCTRAQVVTFLWRYKGSPAPKSKKLNFKDAGQIRTMAADYTSSIQWAAENKITTGYSDGTFKPNRSCTRGECVTFLYRLP